jgi:hypothetical protein
MQQDKTTNESEVAVNSIGSGSGVAMFDPKLGNGKVLRRRRLRDTIPKRK